MTSVSAGHIILTPTQPVGRGRLSLHYTTDKEKFRVKELQEDHNQNAWITTSNGQGQTAQRASVKQAWITTSNGQGQREQQRASVKQASW